MEASLGQLQQSVAAEISLPGVDGKTRKLSDLRGKYVLLDFWATWCGPCRKENPNVVKAYNKYHDKGFEVFSVSIDDPRQRDKWLQVIKSDGMIWENHVLDFQRVAQQQYQVRSIPSTYLIDPEGKIVATNVRGAQLEMMLEKLLN